ncbi:MAG TPA: alpha/beta fold hydrolase [Mycobacteriales bacterium]|nr:alpha/beta fold hydrolase [Mycobacteriales bacterium]
MAQPARVASARRLAAIPNLDALFSARVRQGVGAALADVRGQVVFSAPPVGSWTVHLDDGRVRLTRGSVTHPDATVTAEPETLAAVLDGRISGVEAFLDHGLVVRGNLALALQMDGAFDVGPRPDTHPVAKVLSVLGVRTFYLEAGPADAPPVVLLHGLGATNASMLPLLTDLARDHRVIAPDFPGFGASDAPHWRYRAADLARWLDVFLTAIDARPAALVGNSLGGRVAIEAGLLNPESVSRMVLLCPSPAFRRLRQFVPLVKLLPPDAVVLRVPLAHRAVVAGIRAMFAKPSRLSREWYDAAADEHQRVMRGYRHRRAFFAALRQIYLEEAFGDEGFWDRLPAMTTPALFVWGDRDRLVPSSFERHIVQAIPHAESVVLHDSGHVPQFEHPQRTAELTRAFIDG